MKKVEEAKIILEALGLPKRLQNDRSALILLALCSVKKNSKWDNARQISMSVVGNRVNPKYPGIMRFINEFYSINYAENSRETFRRQTLHQFVQAGIVEHNPENNLMPTNSKDNHYRITDEAFKVIKSYNTNEWENNIRDFSLNTISLKDKYNKDKKINKIPIQIKGNRVLLLSPGKHNEIELAVIKEFAPRFAPGSELVYMGDTAKKDLYLDNELLHNLGLKLDTHSKLPDIVLYDRNKNWLFLIEVATSHGPVTPKRVIELIEIFNNSNAGKIFVSVFPSFHVYKKFANDIAWETEVWIAEKDLFSHLIHFNGDKFLGPR